MNNPLQEAWLELQKEIKIKPQINQEEIMAAITTQSKNPLENLKKGLHIKMNWCLFFGTLCAIGLLLSVNYPQAMLIWSIALVYYAFGWFMIRNHLNKLNITLDYSIKEVLESYHQRVRKVLTIEEGIGAFMIPICGVMGFILSNVYSGMTIPEMFQDSFIVTILLVITLVFGGGGLLLAKKMNRYAFGGHLETLKTNIDLLNSINK